MVRAARRSERGLTLIETLVALAIVFIVFLGLTQAGLLMAEHNMNNTIRDEGVSVAEAAMESARSRPFAALAVLPSTPTTVARPIRNLNVDYVWTPTVTALNADTLQVAIEVTWSRRGRAYNHRVLTLVRNR
jgi:type IV pilus assembly protein PilV